MAALTSLDAAQAEHTRLVREIFQRRGNKRSAEFEAQRLGIDTTQVLLIREQIQQAFEKAAIDDTLEEWLVASLTAPPAFLPLLPLTTTGSTNATHLVSLHNTDPASAVTEVNEDLDKGQRTVKGVSVSQPRTPEEVIQLLQIDETRWRLVQYWNKEKNGRWEISALVARRAASDKLSVEQVQASLRDVFCQPLSALNLPRIEVAEGALIIYSADKHVGADVSRVALYGNHYSVDVYRERMRRILREVHYLVDKHRAPFEKIFYVDLGDHTDGLDGKTCSKTHTLPQNLSNREVFNACLSVEKEFLDGLFTSGCAREYELLQNANSNHSGDFDYFVAAHIEQYVNLRFPQVQTRIMEKFIEHVEYGEHVLLLCHGKDDGDMKHGLPKTLNEKTENYIRKYLQFHQIDVTQKSVTFAKADLHQNASEQVYGLRYRNASSLFGSSKWIQTNFGPGSPGCSYDILSPERDRVWESHLRF